MTTIKILGIRESAKMNLLKSNVLEALGALHLKARVESVTEVDELMKYKINGIPALVVDDTVVLQKQVPPVHDLKILLTVFSEPSKHFGMKNILVPTDFSETSKDALHFAMALAALQNSTVKVMHVWHPEFSPDNPYMLEDVQFGLEEVAEKRLDQFVKEGAGGVNMEKEVRTGFPVEEILESSKSPDLNLIVMGTRGEKGFLEKLFGNVSTHVAQKAKCPVLLVPDGVRFHGFRHVMYASDYEAADAVMMQKLVDFANAFHSDLHFVHVETQGRNNTWEELENRIFNILFKGAEPSFAFNISKVEGRSIAEGLNEYALSHHIDLVVMVSPHRDFWENVFHKSTTKAMALNTRLPIMILHE